MRSWAAAWRGLQRRVHRNLRGWQFIDGPGPSEKVKVLRSSGATAPSPRKKELEGSHGDRQAAWADALGGEALALNDAIRIGGYLLWGLAGLVLGADPNPQGAAAEVARARRTLGVRAVIYRCGNWFRTVAVVPQKD